MISDYVNLEITCELEVLPKDVQVGDVMIGFKLPGDAWCSVYNGAPINWPVTEISNGYVRGTITGATKVQPLANLAAVNTYLRITRSSKKPDKRWNGTCPRCKRGTYTGFSTVEHEGGSCQQS